MSALQYMQGGPTRITTPALRNLDSLPECLTPARGCFWCGAAFEELNTVTVQGYLWFDPQAFETGQVSLRAFVTPKASSLVTAVGLLCGDDHRTTVLMPRFKVSREYEPTSHLMFPGRQVPGVVQIIGEEIGDRVLVESVILDRPRFFVRIADLLVTDR